MSQFSSRIKICDEAFHCCLAKLLKSERQQVYSWKSPKRADVPRCSRPTVHSSHSLIKNTNLIIQNVFHATFIYISVHQKWVMISRYPVSLKFFIKIQRWYELNDKSTCLPVCLFSKALLFTPRSLTACDELILPTEASLFSLVVIRSVNAIQAESSIC